MSEQFENSIRKKLQDAEAPFDPAAWDQMKKRLDDADRRRPAFWWWSGGLGLLFLLGAGGWWWFSQHPPSTSNEPRNSITVTDSISQQAADKPANEEASRRNINGNNTAVDTVDKSSADAVPAVNTAGVSINKPVFAAPLNNTNSNRPGKPAIDNLQGNENLNKPAAGNYTNIATNQLPDTTREQQRENVDKPAVTAAQQDKILNAIPDTASSAAAPEKPAPPRQKIRKRGFEGGITLGPDYNTVPSLKHGRIGFGGGLIIKYHINNSFYLSTGASYTKKLYGAEDKDYSSNYPTNYKIIEADCNVLDVPLNLHYTFLHRPQARWSLMAGASSYFMVKEKYEYYNYSGGKYTREYNNNNHHYFSVLNLGVNYERETRGRINWGIQPFVKVPLGGVGQGSVKLYSAGASLQVTVGKKK
ncbi:porin family protein [Chitinophaga sp.]|uniref:porin family protein n=1 Tax=Chitinophaga sp. TaxID=1869181 RepID=UPI0031E3E74B